MQLNDVAAVLAAAVPDEAGDTLSVRRLEGNGHTVHRVVTRGGDFVLKRYDKQGFFEDHERVSRALLGSPPGFRRLRFEGNIAGVGTVAVYDYVSGRLLADLSPAELDGIAGPFAEMLSGIQRAGRDVAVRGFGPVGANGVGRYATHDQFARALAESGRAVDHPHPATRLALDLLTSPSGRYDAAPACVLIGNNMRNLIWSDDGRPLLLDSGGIAFGDPVLFFGSLLSVVSGTPIWLKTHLRLGGSRSDMRRMYCYAALFAQNIAAFIAKQGHPSALDVRPWASPHSFGDILSICLRHMEELA